MADIDDLIADIEKGPQGPEVGAFFDFDGTLIDGYSAALYFRERLTSGDIGVNELFQTMVEIFNMQQRGHDVTRLVNVALGRWVLHEHLRRLQWIAIAGAATGVAVMMWQLGRPPWIALALAGTWGGYGLLRKKSPLGSLTGLTVETLLLAPLAVGFLLWQHHTGAGALGRADALTQGLVLSAGVITAIPLLLFAFGARRIRLSTMGLLQYLAPTVQFALGVWVYHEPFSRERLIGFLFIWAGLALYTADNLWAQRKSFIA